jgi:hypothetical protein
MDPLLYPSPSHIPSPLKPTVHYPDTTKWPAINNAISRYLLPALPTYSAHRDTVHFTKLRAQRKVHISHNSSFCSLVLATYPAHHNHLHFTIQTIVGDLSKSHSSSSCKPILATYPVFRHFLHFSNLSTAGDLYQRLGFSLYSVIHCSRHPSYTQIFSRQLCDMFPSHNERPRFIPLKIMPRHFFVYCRCINGSETYMKQCGM